MRLRGEGELVRFPNTHRILEGKPMGAGTQLFMLCTPDGKRRRYTTGAEEYNNWYPQGETYITARCDSNRSCDVSPENGGSEKLRMFACSRRPIGCVFRIRVNRYWALLYHQLVVAAPFFAATKRNRK